MVNKRRGRNRALSLLHHGHGAAVLRPRTFIGTKRRRLVLTEGDSGNPCRIHATRNQGIARRIGTALPNRQVVFARAAFIRMALHLHPHFRIAAHPFRLTLHHRALIGADIAAIIIEEHAITDIGDQIFLAAGADIAGAGTGAAAAAGIRVGAGGEQRDAGNP